MSDPVGGHPVRAFFSDLVDYAPKDSPEMMERPFFSLSKRKRVRPIEYQSPDGSVWIKVEGNPLFGMATIWDADILIWCISNVASRSRLGANDFDGTIRTTPHELLTGIARDTGGRDYDLLMGAIKRLTTTLVETNIRSGRRRYVAFHYLGDVGGEGSATDGAPLNTLTLRVSPWLLEGIRRGHVLTLDREYFSITGGIERAIYRIARKHAGGQTRGWTCRISVLHEKTGSEAPLKRFAFNIREMVRQDPLPRYSMRMVRTADGAPAVHFFPRGTEHVQIPLGLDIRDRAKAAWVAGGLEERGFDAAWAMWLDTGHTEDTFIENILFGTSGTGS